MSSCLCKKAEGAIFPSQVESLEDGVDDAVHGLHVDEADHGAGTAANFFNRIVPKRVTKSLL